MNTLAAFAGLCAITTLCGVNAQTPDQLRFYGTELGKPLQLPECAKEKDMFRPNVWRYKMFTSVVCAQAFPATDTSAPGDFSRSAYVMLPAAGPGMKFAGIRVVILDGVVHAAQIETRGFLSQNEIMSDLVRKFGEPTTKTIEKAVNGAGTSFDNIVAKWDISDALQVHFRGMLTRVDEGFLIVGSKRGLAEYVVQQEESSRRLRRGPSM